jgi:hypothetical protein
MLANITTVLAHTRGIDAARRQLALTLAAIEHVNAERG